MILPMAFVPGGIDVTRFLFTVVIVTAPAEVAPGGAFKATLRDVFEGIEELMLPTMLRVIVVVLMV